MPPRRREESVSSFLGFHFSVTDIVALGNRSFEPYFKNFRYSDDNVTKSNLGTLFGVFSIDDNDEDSAYIVNFLASVAKKEYFNNPRRESIESFEAALHKINIALAELVKHGNVSWLGKFHGVLCAVDKKSAHFSVTGQGSILLLRQGILTDISSGLATEESKTHPLKTFVEVSSGKLMPHDKFILSSPELLALFSREDIQKNALRMDNQRFAQFLRTAVVNECDRAGTLIIDVSETMSSSDLESLSIQPKRKKPEPAAYVNAFSENAFVKPLQSKPLPPSATTSDSSTAQYEYVDSKTGHIYVQGDTSDPSVTPPLRVPFERIVDQFKEWQRSAVLVAGRMRRRFMKNTATVSEIGRERLGFLGKKIIRVARTYFRRIRKRGLSSSPSLPPTKMDDMPPPRDPRQIPLENEDTKKSLTSVLFATSQQKWRSLFEKRKRPSDEHPVYPTPKYRQWQQLFQLRLHSLYAWLRQYSHSTITYFPTWNIRLVLLAVVLVSIIGLAGMLWTIRDQETFPSSDQVTSPERETVLTEPKDNNSIILPEKRMVTKSDTPLLTLLFLDKKTFLVSNRSVQDVSEGTTYAFPGEHSIRFAVPMDDLRLLFLLTDANELYAFSPLNRSFIRNTLPLSEDIRIESMGSYLTYLYLLDSAHNQIYRFPRTPGGFGSSIGWLKESFEIEPSDHIIVNENIFLASGNAVYRLFRGRQEKTLELPATPSGPVELYYHSDTDMLYALDQTNRRILVWNNEGVLIHQYVSDELADASSFGVSENGREIFFTVTTTLFSFSLE